MIVVPRPADAAVLAALMRETFLAAYGQSAPASDVAAHLARHFTPEAVARDLSDPAQACLVIAAGARWLGYGTLHYTPPPAPGVPAGAAQVRRFYLRPEAQGTGAADRLMAAVVEHAAARGADALWLNLWQEAARARRFYERHRFAPVGSAPFLLGSHVQQDWIMLRPVVA